MVQLGSKYKQCDSRTSTLHYHTKLPYRMKDKFLAMHSRPFVILPPLLSPFSSLPLPPTPLRLYCDQLNSMQFPSTPVTESTGSQSHVRAFAGSSTWKVYFPFFEWLTLILPSKFSSNASLSKSCHRGCPMLVWVLPLGAPIVPDYDSLVSISHLPEITSFSVYLPTVLSTFSSG